MSDAVITTTTQYYEGIEEYVRNGFLNFGNTFLPYVKFLDAVNRLEKDANGQIDSNEYNRLHKLMLLEAAASHLGVSF